LNDLIKEEKLLKTVYKCYSANLKQYLLNLNFKYDWVDINPINNKTFWLFTITDELSKALKEWSNNKPVKSL
jgi:hypothetical protein